MSNLIEIKKEFEGSNLLPLFEIKVYRKDTGEEDYIVFHLSIQKLKKISIDIFIFI